MKLKALAIAAVLAIVAIPPAEARPTQSSSAEWPAMAYSSSADTGSGARPERSRDASRRATRSSTTHDTRGESSHSGLGPRPSQWCGWYMRQRHGGGPDMNLAWNWSRYGSSASPQVGAIVVWHHHVGEIVGQAPNGQWIVLSGNDSGGVRQRARSIAGAVVRI